MIMGMYDPDARSLLTVSGFVRGRETSTVMNLFPVSLWTRTLSQNLSSLWYIALLTMGVNYTLPVYWNQYMELLWVTCGYVQGGEKRNQSCPVDILATEAKQNEAPAVNESGANTEAQWVNSQTVVPTSHMGTSLILPLSTQFPVDAPRQTVGDSPSIWALAFT